MSRFECEQCEQKWADCQCDEVPDSLGLWDDSALEDALDPDPDGNDLFEGWHEGV